MGTPTTTKDQVYQLDIKQQHRNTELYVVHSFSMGKPRASRQYTHQISDGDVVVGYKCDGLLSQDISSTIIHKQLAFQPICFSSYGNKIGT